MTFLTDDNRHNSIVSIISLCILLLIGLLTTYFVPMINSEKAMIIPFNYELFTDEIDSKNLGGRISPNKRSGYLLYLHNTDSTFSQYSIEISKYGIHKPITTSKKIGNIHKIDSVSQMDTKFTMDGIILNSNRNFPLLILGNETGEKPEIVISKDATELDHSYTPPHNLDEIITYCSVSSVTCIVMLIFVIPPILSLFTSQNIIPETTLNMDKQKRSRASELKKVANHKVEITHSQTNVNHTHNYNGMTNNGAMNTGNGSSQKTKSISPKMSNNSKGLLSKIFAIIVKIIIFLKG